MIGIKLLNQIFYLFHIQTKYILFKSNKLKDYSNIINNTSINQSNLGSVNQYQIVDSNL